MARRARESGSSSASARALAGDIGTRDIGTRRAGIERFSPYVPSGRSLGFTKSPREGINPGHRITSPDAVHEGGQLATITMKELLEAGVHFGHQTKRWNPKMKEYIFGERNGIYIIDLQKTLKLFKEASKFVVELCASGKTILFVGTKRQAQDAVAEEATRAGMPYINQGWLGGQIGRAHV